MRKWKKVKIGELFNIEKGVLQSSKCTPGKYPFITAASEWKTHNEYSHNCEALIYAVAASGSLGRVHYIKGKFISSDLCFILTEKNHSEYPINYQFYHLVLEFLRDEIVSATKTGTSKESINRKNFSEYEIPYIPIAKQSSHISMLLNAKEKTILFNEEYDKQKAYTKQLRQSVLQDAIEGKLTEDWRKTHPVEKGNPDYDAQALFQKIQEEKEKQATGKKKASNNFAEITDEEKPFQIPTGWKWIRLGEISESILYGISESAKENGAYKLLRITDIQNDKVDWDSVPYTDYDEKKVSHYFLIKGDILFARTGGTVGKSYLVIQFMHHI